MFVLQRHSTPLLYYLPCRMANHVDQPVFQIRLVEPHSPWLSDRVENSLTDHFNFNQYITDQQPLFHDLIQDNPGYDLYPSHPVQGPLPEQDIDTDIDLTVYEDPSLANDSSQAVEQIVDNDSIGEDSTVVSGLGSFEEPVRLPDDSLDKSMHTPMILEHECSVGSSWRCQSSQRIT